MEFEQKLVTPNDSSDRLPIHAILTPDAGTYMQAMTDQDIKAKDYTSKGVNTLTRERLEEVLLSSPLRPCPQVPENVRRGRDEQSSSCHELETPLGSRSNFFAMLKVELIGIRGLQTKVEAELIHEVISVSQSIAKAATPADIKVKTDLEAWREILGSYADAAIFFSTNERDIHTRDAGTADLQLQLFELKLRNIGYPQRFRIKDSRLALDRFLRVNRTLLQSLRFQELSLMATTKILKSE